MNVGKQNDVLIANIAAAIGEPARVRMLYCLLDGRARTATELAVVSGIVPSTASAHLNRLMKERLIKVLIQGKHHYYSLFDSDVADVLEKLSVLGGVSGNFVPNTPAELRNARTCYDHIAGRIGVALHDCFKIRRWLIADANNGYELTSKAKTELQTLGVDVEDLRSQRRKFAYPCVDWSERQPHIGGALGAAILKIALKKKWMIQAFDSRALNVTRIGKRELQMWFGLPLE